MIFPHRLIQPREPQPLKKAPTASIWGRMSEPGWRWEGFSPNARLSASSPPNAEMNEPTPMMKAMIAPGEFAAGLMARSTGLKGNALPHWGHLISVTRGLGTLSGTRASCWHEVHLTIEGISELRGWRENSQLQTKHYCIARMPSATPPPSPRALTSPPPRPCCGTSRSGVRGDCRSCSASSREASC